MSRPLIVEADGGSRGNPGPAGYGAVVRDADTGEVLAERSGFLGVATNNVAEYRGLLAGLEAAAALSPTSVEVRLDSRLVVEQVSGRWQVKHPGLRPLARAAVSAVAALPQVRLVWVPRARNAAADRLANLAMDNRGETHGDPTPPTRSSTVNRLSGWMDAPAPPATLLLLRHGATAMSLRREFSGRSDPDLSDMGREQASRAAAATARWASQAGITAVVSSPRQRARATAVRCAEALGVTTQIEDDLRETDFGAWEGLTFTEVSKRWPDDLRAWLDDPALAPPGGESFTETQRRVLPTLDRLAGSYSGARLLIVSHVSPIKLAVAAALLAPLAALYRLHLDTAALSVVDYFPDGPRVLRSFNDTAHLSEDREPATS